MKVVVISEDHTLDAYIIRPVVEAIFKELCKPATRITMVPRIGGVVEALKQKTLGGAFETYPMADVFLLIVDRDCDEFRESGQIASRLQEANAAGKACFACVAIEELETWALALHHDELNADWKRVRAECHPKERYFAPLAERKKWLAGPGKGRAAAMKPLSNNWERLKARCHELQSLLSELGTWLRKVD